MQETPFLTPNSHFVWGVGWLRENGLSLIMMLYGIKSQVIRAAKVLMALSVALIACGCGTQSNGHDHFYRTMTINPQSLQVTFSNPIPNDSESSGPFFWPFTMSTGDYSVDHDDGKHLYPHRVRFNAFTVSPTNRLEYREKYQELVSGPFGTVYADTNNFYQLPGRPASTAYIEFNILYYFTELEHEPPLVIPSPPTHSPHNLDAISLIRIFQSGQHYIVVIAKYLPTGHMMVSQYMPNRPNLYFVKRFETQEGDPPTSSETSTDIGTYGFPIKIPVGEYLKKPKPLWKPVAPHNVMNIVNFHYDRSKWVRQDTFVAANRPTTRYLTYVTTAQDVMLAPVDQKMPYKVVGY